MKALIIIAVGLFLGVCICVISYTEGYFKGYNDSRNEKYPRI